MKNKNKLKKLAAAQLAHQSVGGSKNAMFEALVGKIIDEEIKKATGQKEPQIIQLHNESIEANHDKIVIQFPTLDFRKRMFERTAVNSEFDFADIDGEFINRSFDDIIELLVKVRRQLKYTDFSRMSQVIIRPRNINNPNNTENCRRHARNKIFEMEFLYDSKENHDKCIAAAEAHSQSNKKLGFIDYVEQIQGARGAFFDGPVPVNPDFVTANLKTEPLPQRPVAESDYLADMPPEIKD